MRGKKLTSEQIRQIRAAHKAGELIQAIAKRVGVSPRQVFRILAQVRGHANFRGYKTTHPGVTSGSAAPGDTGNVPFGIVDYPVGNYESLPVKEISQHLIIKRLPTALEARHEERRVEAILWWDKHGETVRAKDRL